MQKNKTFDVVGMGGCAVDMVATMDGPLRPDAKQRMRKFQRFAGGTAANTMVGLTRLGLQACYLGKLGTDDDSQLIISDFIAEGVDTSRIIQDDLAGVYLAFIMVDEQTHHRTVLWSDDMVRPLRAEDICREMVSCAEALYLDDWGLHDFEAASQAVAFAKESGTIVVLDAENPQKHEYLSLLPSVDYLIIAQEYALAVSEKDDCPDAARRFLQHGAGVVVITQGAQGCLVATKKGIFSQEAFAMTAVDTTGCGDAFHAGFIYGLLQNWELESVSEFSCAVAAKKCEKLGARTGLPSLAEVVAFLQSHGSEQIRRTIGGH